VPLLIVDEVGYIPFDPEAAALFFALVSSRYERRGLIVSSNKTFSAWAEIFGDPVAVAAMAPDRSSTGRGRDPHQQPVGGRGPIPPVVRFELALSGNLTPFVQEAIGIGLVDPGRAEANSEGQFSVLGQWRMNGQLAPAQGHRPRPANVGRPFARGIGLRPGDLHGRRREA
jgi:hypothetical protein